MTLIVAVGCTDGVVIGAECASTDSEVGTKQPAIKIKQIGNHPILYGGSGDAGLLQKIHESLERLTPPTSLKNLRQNVRKLILPDIKDAIDNHVAYPQQGFHVPPPAILLLAGVLHNKPWILEVERDGRDTMYNEDMGYFAAIGSGKPWAQAVFRPHLNSERNLYLGKVFTNRILEDSIELAAGGLARPIYIYTITASGTVSTVADTEMQELSRTCELWRSLEREAVGKLLAGQEQDESAPEIPTPETT